MDPDPELPEKLDLDPEIIVSDPTHRFIVLSKKGRIQV